MLAAVAVNVVVAWLIVLAGRKSIWCSLFTPTAPAVSCGSCYRSWLSLFRRISTSTPSAGDASLTLALAALFVIEGILNLVLFFKMRTLHGSTWVLVDGIITILLG